MKRSRTRAGQGGWRARPAAKPVRSAQPSSAGAAAADNDDARTADTLIAAAASMLALAIDPAWHDAVRMNLQAIFLHARRIEEFSLPDETEPAPVFRA